MLGWEYPPYVTGGLGTHCHHLTDALAKLPVKVYFVTPHPIHKKKGNLEIIGLDISQKFKEDGEIVSYGHFKKEKIALYTQKIPEIINRYDFDVIHCQDWLPMYASILAKDLLKKPLVLTMHSTAYDRRKKPKVSAIKRERRGMECADKIIAVSDYTKSIIVNKYNINPRKIFVIRNAVKQKKALLKKRTGKTKYILYLGRLSYQKGISYLIKAAAKVLKKEKNVKFLIIGKGRSVHEEKLKKEVRRLGLEKNVIFLGYVKNKDYYYRKAYLFVMPSVSEPFGIVPLEAMSNGTPAIISKQSGISEVLNNCIKFDYWDTEDLAKKILMLLNNKKLYDSLRKKGFKEVKSFSWESIARETVELYNKMI